MTTLSKKLSRSTTDYKFSKALKLSTFSVPFLYNLILYKVQPEVVAETAENVQAEPEGNETVEAVTGGNETIEAVTGGNETVEAVTGGNETVEAVTGGNETAEAESVVPEGDGEEGAAPRSGYSHN